MTTNSPPPFPLPAGASPLDPSQGDWLWSTVEQRWHFVSEPCRFAGTIYDKNRQYRKDPPPRQEVCQLCRKHYDHLFKAA